MANHTMDRAHHKRATRRVTHRQTRPTTRQPADSQSIYKSRQNMNQVRLTILNYFLLIKKKIIFLKTFQNFKIILKFFFQVNFQIEFNQYQLYLILKSNFIFKNSF